MYTIFVTIYPSNKTLQRILLWKILP